MWGILKSYSGIVAMLISKIAVYLTNFKNLLIIVSNFNSSCWPIPICRVKNVFIWKYVTPVVIISMSR